jgi:hypothetical protein
MARHGRGRKGAALAGLIVLLLVLACAPLSGAGGPSVEITSPASGTRVELGQEVEITSTSSADAGIARVELYVDGDLVREDEPPSGNPETFRLVQQWLAERQGEVRVAVVAYDAQGESSSEAAIALSVVAGVGEADAEATPTPVPDVEVEGCTLNASFVADVTIPDDTVMTPGAEFVKSWRIRNRGTCDWGEGFSLVFVSGNQMGGPASIPVAETPAGGVVDVSAELEAPETYGTHRGSWRMQSDEAAMFGSTFWVQIVVPAPATPTATPPPEATPTPTSGIVIHPGILTMLPPLFTVLPVTAEIRRAEETVSVGPGAIGYATAHCPSGSLVVSGGYSASPNAIVYTHQAVGNGWQAWARNNSSSEIPLVVFATCLLGSGGSMTARNNSTSVPAGEVGSVLAACPSGSVVVGGGWGVPSEGSLQVYSSKKKHDVNGWEVRAENNSGSSATLTARVVCLLGTAATVSEITESDGVAPGAYQEVSCSCPSGTVVTGGGFFNPWGAYSMAHELGTQDTWGVFVTNRGTSNQTVMCYGVCLSLP